MLQEILKIEPILPTVALYLLALVVGILVFRRLGLGTALGYLVIGAVAGPTTLGLLGSSEAIESLADFGVVLLLFVVGLELRPVRIWRLRWSLFGLGGAQVVLTTAVLAFGLQHIFGFDWALSVVIGSALSLSSTAFGVQLLTEKGEVGTAFGDRALSILLFQDLALVPLIAFVTLYAKAGFAGIADVDPNAIVIAVGSIAVLVLFGHYLIGPFFRLIARSGAEEAFTAGALLVVVAAALLMRYAGLSMGLGGLIAGALLAESEFRQRIEVAVEPFRGLLLGVFFVGIGVSIDWEVVRDAWRLVIGGAVVAFSYQGSDPDCAGAHSCTSFAGSVADGGASRAGGRVQFRAFCACRHQWYPADREGHPANSDRGVLHGSDAVGYVSGRSGHQAALR